MAQVGSIGLATRGLAVVAVIAGLAASTTTAASAQHAGSPQRAHGVSPQRTPLGVGSLSGAVVTASGAPAAGTCVAVASLRAEGGSPANATRLTTAGALGRYFFAGLPSGVYRLGFERCPTGGAASPAHLGAKIDEAAPTRVVTVVAGVLRPVARVVLPAAPFQIGPDGHATLSSLFGRLVTLEGRAAGRSGAGSISGRVTGPGGAPVSGICAVAATAAGRAVESPTSPSGAYVLSGLRAGGYSVIFTPGCGNNGNWLDPSSRSTSLVEVVARRPTRGIDGRLGLGSSISGVVTNSRGHALSQICVTAISEVGGSISIYQTFGIGRNGAYQLDDLSAGPYTVSFAGCGSQNVAPQWWDDGSEYQQATVIRISAAKPATGIDAAMAPGGSITGVVANKGGKGLAGICVMVTTQLTKSVTFGVEYASGSGGSFSIPSLGTGTYNPQFTTGCGNNGNYAPTTDPTPVDVVAGHVTSAGDVTMSPGATISGKVTNSLGHGLSGICVQVAPVSLTTPIFVLPAATRANGAYAVDQLPAGGYQVEFVPGCPSLANYITQFYDDHTSPAEADVITLAPGGKARGIDATLQVGGILSGSVTDPSGAPELGACVVAGPIGQGFVGSLVFGLIAAYGTQAGLNGRYEILGLPTDSYVVFVDPTCGGAFQSSSAAAYYGGGTSYPPRRLVSVTAGQSTGDIDVALATGGSIAGTVKPAGFGCLYVLGTDGTLREQVVLQPQQNDGYGLEGLLPGSYLVAASSCLSDSSTAPDFYPDGQTLQQARPITVTANATTTGIDFNLPKTAEITGHVSQPGGDPAPACITAVDQSDPNVVDEPITFTNRGGNYVLTGMGTGTYVLAFGGCGRLVRDAAVLSAPVSVTDGMTVSGVDATLQSAGSVTGTVTSTAGTPLGGVCVFAAGVPGGAGSTEAETSGDGTYDLVGVPAGETRLRFIPQCGIDGTWSTITTAPVRVVSGEQSPGINAKLAAGGSVSGRVTGTSHSPASQICVLAVPTTAGVPTVIATTGTDGSYSITGVQHGSYDVEFTDGCGNATEFVTQWWQDAGSQADATAVTVPSGSVARGIDAQLAVAP